MAKKGKESRIVIGLACTVCKKCNYHTSKNKKNTPGRLGLKKFCRYCRQSVPHQETK
jgi:large subunit ribosomal protein L33